MTAEEKGFHIIKFSDKKSNQKSRPVKFLSYGNQRGYKKLLVVKARLIVLTKCLLKLSLRWLSIVHQFRMKLLRNFVI